MTSLREESALSDFGNAHQRKHNEYSYRLPSAPRIVVPPPTLTTDMPGLSVGSTAAAPGADDAALAVSGAHGGGQGS
jgi:hypothetical protein